MNRILVTSISLLLISTSAISRETKKNAWGVQLGQMTHKAHSSFSFDAFGTTTSYPHTGMFYERTFRSRAKGKLAVYYSIQVGVKDGWHAANMTFGGVPLRAVTSSVTFPVLLRFNFLQKVDDATVRLFIGNGAFYSNVTNHRTYAQPGRTIPASFDTQLDFNKMGFVIDAGGGISFGPRLSIFLMYRAFQDLKILGDEGTVQETPTFFSYGFHAGYQHLF